MYGRLFDQSPLIAFPIIGLALFGISFVAILIRTMRRTTEDYRSIANLPLADEISHVKPRQ
jgi:hypothetical protein